MKKFLSLMLTVAISVSVLSGCRDSASVEKPENNSSGDYKIGVITGTVSQGEEEFMAAENMKKKYGDMIVTATYPDNFVAETETFISVISEMASDPKIKAIVLTQAVQGTSAAIDKVKETRDDILFFAGISSEDPETISEKADVVFLIDEVGVGRNVIKQAKKQGAKTFVHYSFPRHFSIETIKIRKVEMEKACEELGIKYVEVTAPDPLSDAGVSGAQQFIIEDVPRQVKEYGVDTAFFSTNCSMQEPLIRTVLEQKAIFPQQCCPSPYHGYPTALGIDVKGHEGDVAYMLEQTKAKVAGGGNSGRMSTWKFPVNMLSVEAGVEYAKAFCEGKTNGKMDAEVVKAKINEVAMQSNAECTISNFITNKDGKDLELKNFFVVLGDFYEF